MVQFDNARLSWFMPARQPGMNPASGAAFFGRIRAVPPSGGKIFAKKKKFVLVESAVLCHN
jgi:hypothetical protein